MLLIGRDLSPYTRRVAVSMTVLDFDFDRQHLTAWDHLPDVRRYNPVGRVPCLVLDSGEVLFDSGAILDYVDELVGPERALISPSGARRREVMRHVVCATGVLDKAAHSRYERVMRPPEKIHQPWLDHNAAQMRSALTWLEQQVEQSTAFRLEALTQSAVTTVVAHDFLRVADPELFQVGEFPNLDALAQAARAIPAFADTHPG